MVLTSVCHTGGDGSILSDVLYFYGTVTSLGSDLDSQEDASAKDLRLRTMGYALLDMAKLSCRLMTLVVEQTLVSSPGASG